MRTSFLALGLIAAAVGSLAQNSNDQCVSLRGSTTCPSFQDAYVNPTNLSRAWPWFSAVSDVSSFDDQFNRYFTDPTRFHAQKFGRELECTSDNADNATLQWQRTILCGQFTQITYSAQCNQNNQANPIMVCRDTCVQYSNTEKDIVSNPQICTPDARLTRTENATRYATLNNDYVDCTDWTSLVSTNNQTCVEGIENEGNCGWGPGVSDQLCAYCDPSGNNTVSSCCYDAKTDLSQCADYGFPLAARISPTMSVPAQIGSTSTGAPSSTGASSSDRSGNSSRGTRLTGGQLAGIIVGSIVGALLLGALLALLFLRLCRRNRDGESAGRQNLVYGAAARGSGNEKPWNQSDEGTARSLGGSPPMGSEKYATGAAGAGVGLGAAALAASGAAAGNRNTENRPISAMTGSSGTDGRGTTVSFVRDQYSGHDIRPGDQVVTVYPYHASLNDEISIEPDEVLVVLRLYDDGWALGKTATTEGAFPLVCVTSAKSTTPRPSTDAPTARAAPTDGGLTSEAEGAVTADEGFTTSNSEGNGSSTRR